jgi:hypothetical protein
MPDTFEYDHGSSVYMSGHSEWIIRRQSKPGIIASITGHERHAQAAVDALNQAARHDEFSAAKVREHADRLAAALHTALYDAHPTYGSTAGWRGGIGGQAVTTGCASIDPPPGDTWMTQDTLSRVLRTYIDAYGPDLAAAKATLRTTAEEN